MPEFTTQDFVGKYKPVTSLEKRSYQEHIGNLCRLMEHPTSNDADPTRTRYAIEMGAAKTVGVAKSLPGLGETESTENINRDQ